MKIRTKTNHNITYTLYMKYSLSDIAQDTQPLACMTVKFHAHRICIYVFGVKQAAAVVVNLTIFFFSEFLLFLFEKFIQQSSYLSLTAHTIYMTGFSSVNMTGYSR